jgi:hypothetical protein
MTLILILASLAACPQEPATETDTDGSVAVEPCTLVTTSEVEAALGSEVAEPSRDTLEGTGELCVWEGEAGKVNLVVYDEADPEALRSEDAPGEEVAGLGDSAYYYSLTGDLKVVSGSVQFHVGVFDSSLQPSKEAALELARLAVERVPAPEV